MKRWTRLIPALGLLFLAGCAAAGEAQAPADDGGPRVVRSAECRWAGAPIRVDGVLSEVAWDRAQVLRWMFFEEDFIQNGLASLRHWTMTGKLARRSGEKPSSPLTCRDKAYPNAAITQATTGTTLRFSFEKYSDHPGSVGRGGFRRGPPN